MLSEVVGKRDFDVKQDEWSFSFFDFGLDWRPHIRTRMYAKTKEAASCPLKSHTDTFLWSKMVL